MAKTGIKALAADRAGYTLTELLVVLAIIALGSAVIAPRMVGKNSDRAIRSVAIQFENECRRARQLALQTGISQQVIIAPESRTMWVADQPGKFQFRQEIFVEAITADREATYPLAGIRFFADGASTGGEVSFFSPEIRYRVKVVWANGEIRVEKDH